MTKNILCILILFWSLGSSGAEETGTTNSPHYQSILEKLQAEQEIIIEEAGKSTVVVILIPRIGISGDFPGEVGGLGSGSILTKDGYIVTNRHVADASGFITKKMLQEQENLPYDYDIALADGRKFEASLIALHEYTDLALLKIKSPPQDLVIAKRGDSGRLRPGHFVYAIGSPFGFEQSVSFGVVSNTSRTVPGKTKHHTYIQTDAAINPGNSGGPLVNIAGEIVGVNTMYFGPQETGNIGIGFAIPSTVLWDFLETVDAGRLGNGWIDITTIPLDDEIRMMLEAFGSLPEGDSSDLYVSSVGSEKWLPYFKVNDVIISIDGKIIKDPLGFSQYVANRSAGAILEIVLWRSGSEISISVPVAERQ